MGQAVLVLIIFIFINCLHAHQPLPVTKIYKVSYVNGSEAWEILRDSETLIVERKGKTDEVDLVLNCSAYYPIAWQYTGNGAPDISMNASEGGFIGRKRIYETTAILKSIKEKYTGKYSCVSYFNKELENSHHIFVPGPSLYSSNTGGKVKYDPSATEAIIPCAVTRPNIRVALQKSIFGNLVSIDDSLYDFDPKFGFRLKLSREFDNPEGTYVCTASHHNIFRVVEYIMIPKENFTCMPQCGKNAECRVELILRAERKSCSCIGAYQGDPLKECFLSCGSNENCPSDLKCKEEEQRCFDPCTDDGFCDPGEVCKVLNHEPQCSKVQKPGSMSTSSNYLVNFLMERFTGDGGVLDNSDPCDPNPCGPGGECVAFGTEHNCTCRRGYLQRNGICKAQCDSHADCYAPKICDKKNYLYPKCVHPCDGYCGSRAECNLVNQKPVCSCPQGFTGDPDEYCKRIEDDRVISSSSSIVTSNSKIDEKNVCSTCGEHGICNIDQNGGYSCACQPDTIGSPPNCLKSCSESSNCEFDEICRRGTCYKTIYDPCKKCGVGSQCQFVSHGVRCTCPEGSRGDPYEGCYAITFHSPSTPIRHSLRPTHPHVQNDEISKYVNTESQICKIVLGHPNCHCREGYTGTPPACKLIHSDYEESAPKSGNFCLVPCRNNQKCIGGVCIGVTNDPLWNWNRNYNLQVK